VNGTSVDLHALMQSQGVPPSTTSRQTPWGLISDLSKTRKKMINKPLEQIQNGYCSYVAPTVFSNFSYQYISDVAITMERLEDWIDSAIGENIVDMIESLLEARNSLRELHNRLESASRNLGVTFLQQALMPHKDEFLYRSFFRAHNYALGIGRLVLSLVKFLVVNAEAAVGIAQEVLEELIAIELKISTAVDHLSEVDTMLSMPYDRYVVPFTRPFSLSEGFSSVAEAVRWAEPRHEEYVKDNLTKVAIRALDDGFQTGAFLAELPETSRLGRDIASIGSKIPIASNLWLLYNFAIAPLLGDLSTMMEDLTNREVPYASRAYDSYAHYEGQPEYFNDTRFGTSNAHSTQSFGSGSLTRDVELFPPSSGSIWCDFVHTDLAAGVNITRLYNRANESHKQLVARYFAGKYDPYKGVDLWNAIPFSFLVDYFIDVGSLFAYADNRDNLRALSSGSDAFWATDKLFVGSARMTGLNQAGCMSGWGHARYRRRTSLDVTVPTLSLQQPKLRQVLNVFALFDSSARSR
jgi:hypothetical protein